MYKNILLPWQIIKDSGWDDWICLHLIHTGGTYKQYSAIADLHNLEFTVAHAMLAGRPLPPRKIPGTHFCQRLSRPQGHSAAGRIWSIKKSSDLIGNRRRDLPACSIVPQSTTLSHAPIHTLIHAFIYNDWNSHLESMFGRWYPVLLFHISQISKCWPSCTRTRNSYI
jgi:hypothetical protein